MQFESPTSPQVFGSGASLILPSPETRAGESSGRERSSARVSNGRRWDTGPIADTRPKQALSTGYSDAVTLDASHRAQLALNGKNPTEAIRYLQAASSIEFGAITFLNNISCLYPTYIRGEAYLAAGRVLLPPPSSKKSPTTATSSGTAGRARWRDWAWPERTRWQRKRRKARTLMPPAGVPSRPTGISSLSGKTPIETSPS